jgi:hypothetical protein
MSSRRCEWSGFGHKAVAAVAVALFLAASSSPGQSPRPRNNPQAKDNSNNLLASDLRAKDPPALTANAIVEKMMAANGRRSAELRGYQATRSYNLQYRGLLGSRNAEMKVVARYTAPGQRDFSVISQSGSKLLLNRVLLKLLDSEKEASRNQKQVELSPANYQFDFLGTDRMPGGAPSYVLAVKPQHDNKFLYRGKIWVDVPDFAVVRMQGQPAKSPSFWIKDTEINANWEKVGKFWFIKQNHSVSHIRMGGMADLTIEYADYQITGVDTRGPHNRSESPVLPDPSSVTPQR